MKRARAEWTGVVLVCGKCSKKVGGGFGKNRRTRLAKALRKCSGFGKGRKAAVGVIETKCLGLCPKNAVTVVDAQRAGEWLVVSPGEDVGALANQLLQRHSRESGNPSPELAQSEAVIFVNR